MGCRACEIACAVEHSLSKSIYEAPYEIPKPIPRIRVLPIDIFYVPARCQHCEDAPCIAVCPTKALSKTDEGFVIVDPMKCIGCLMCALACPFGHPRYSAEEKTMIKCDFCYTRVREGKPPACVEACPTGALRFGRFEEVMKEVAEEKMRAVITGKAGPGLVVIKPVKIEVEVKPTPPAKVSDVKSMYKPVSWS
mgnify:CR=1 FL=1